MQTRFIQATLSSSSWVKASTALSLSSTTIFAIQFRNITGQLEVRNATETGKVDVYAKDEIYGLQGVPNGFRYELENLEIKGASGDTIKGEYQAI